MTFNLLSMWLWVKVFQPFEQGREPQQLVRAPTDKEIEEYIEKVLGGFDDVSDEFRNHKNAIAHDLSNSLNDQKFDFWLNLWENAYHDRKHEQSEAK